MDPWTLGLLEVAPAAVVVVIVVRHFRGAGAADAAEEGEPASRAEPRASVTELD